MSKKNKIIIGILLITAILVVTGVSYALWQINLEQNSTNVITSSCFKIELQDNNPINIQSAYPISDEEGSILTPYTFTIKNTCDAYASYQINLEILNTTTLENVSFLKVMLEDKSLLSELEDTSKTLENAKSSKKIETGYLDRNQEKTFELRIWLDENTPTNEEFMNKIFESKITVISSYISEFDREEPIASFEVTRTDKELIIDASGSYDEMSNIKNYYYSRDGINYEKSKSSSYTFKIDENIKYGKGTEALHLFAESTASEIYVKVEDEFGNISSGHKKTLGELAFDNTEDNNLRYIGSNPNNYVSFNNELWRIIGVMNNIEDGNGVKESRLKLIKTAVFISKAWNAVKNNDWTNSSIKSELNGTYLQNLKDTDLIDNVKWKLGTSHHNTNVFEKYIEERGENVCGSKEWLGKISLIYASDYGYATSGIDTSTREACLKTLMPKWNNEENCKNNSWISNTTYHQWLLTPANEDCTMASHLTTFGYVSHNPVTAKSEHAISPALYLKPDVKIISGVGSPTDPFLLDLTT